MAGNHRSGNKWRAPDTKNQRSDNALRSARAVGVAPDRVEFEPELWVMPHQLACNSRAVEFWKTRIMPRAKAGAFAPDSQPGLVITALLYANLTDMFMAGDVPAAPLIKQLDAMLADSGLNHAGAKMFAQAELNRDKEKPKRATPSSAVADLMSVVMSDDED